MLNPFVWLRQMAKAAIVNGLSDALQEVTLAGVEPPTDLRQLEERLAAAAQLPAAKEPEEAAVKKKGK